MSGLISDTFNYAQYKVVKKIKIWLIRRPEFLEPKHIDVI